MCGEEEELVPSEEEQDSVASAGQIFLRFYHCAHCTDALRRSSRRRVKKRALDYDDFTRRKRRKRSFDELGQEDSHESEREAEKESEKIRMPLSEKGRSRLRTFLQKTAAEHRENRISAPDGTPRAAVRQRKRCGQGISPRDQRKKYQKQYHQRRKSSGKFMPSWCTPSNVGKLSERCQYCAALHFKDEPKRCCDKGIVSLPPLEEPPEPLKELLECKTPRARHHQQLLPRINTLFAFAAKQCNEEQIPGKGVPITKVRGTYSHTLSSIRPSRGRAAFGALYALDDPHAATEFRLANERVCEGINDELVVELAQMFDAFNECAKEFKFMGNVLKEK